MSGFVGMDIGRVRALADQLEARAAELDRAVGTVDSALSSLRSQGLWMGTDFDDAESVWKGIHRPACQRVVEQCHESASLLGRQVLQQAEASDESLGIGTPGGVGEVCAEPSRLSLLELAAGATHPPSRIDKWGHAWTPVSDDELRRLGIDPSLMVDASTGFTAVLYRDEAGAYVLSFGNTDPSSFQDILNDGVGAAPASLSRQSEEAVLLAGILAGSLDGPLSFTGHSLGGRLAALASIRTGLPATTFNAAGVSDSEFFFALEAAGKDGHKTENVIKATGFMVAEAVSFVSPPNALVVGMAAEGWDLYSDERAALLSQVTNINTQHDGLSNAQESTGLANAVGTQVEISNDDWWRPVTSHNIDEIRESLIRAEGGR